MSTQTASAIILERLAAESVIRVVANEFQQSSITFDLQYCEPTSNPALLIEVGGPLGVGRITWWSDGNLCAEAIHEMNGENLLMQNMEAPTAGHAIAALKSVVHALLGEP